MAKDVITRFKLETTAFDSKIKQASKELSDYSKTATKAKEGFNQFTKANVDAARALGTMATSSTNAKQKTQELVGAFNEAAKAYNNLTKEQQKSDFGKALAGSLTTLQQRIRETKQELQGMSETMKSSGLFGGGKLDGMLQVFGGNIMTKAAGFAASFASEIGSCVQQGIELARQGEGIRNAFARLGRGDILDGLREATHGTVTDIELMKAAVKFNDFKLPVEELGTMLAFAQQKAKDTGQSVDYMVDSIVTGLGRKSLMILDNLGLSAAEIKEKMKQTGDMTKAVGSIIRDQMAKAGDYVETAADRAAQANVSLQNKMEELGRKFAPVEEASNQLWTSMKIGILDIIGGPLAQLLNGLTEAGRLRNMLNNMNGQDGSGNTKVDQQLKKLQVIRKAGGSDYIYNSTLNGMLEDYNRQIMALDAQIKNGGKKPGTGSGESQDVRYLQRQMDALAIMRDQLRAGAKEIEKPVKVNVDTNNAIKGIGDLKKQLKELEDQRKKAVLAGDDEQVDFLTKQINSVKQNIGYLDPKALKTTTKKDLDELQKIQKQIADLTKEAYTADESRQAEIQKQIAGLQKQEKKLISIKELVTGTAKGPDLDKMFPDSSAQNYNTGYARSIQAKIDSATADMAMGPLSIDNVTSYINIIKGALKDVDLGSELYNSLTEKLKDATTMSTLLENLISMGLQGADLEHLANSLREKLLSPEGIDQEAVKKWLDGRNEKIKDVGGLQLEIDTATGKVGLKTDDKDSSKRKNENKEFTSKAKQFTSGLSEVASGLRGLGVKLPDGVEQVVGIVNSVISVIEGVNTVIGAFQVSAITANTTALAANTAAILATGFLPFANGGIVPNAAMGRLIGGNSFSGDNIFAGNAWVNSGELVLNRAQQGVLASALEDGTGNIHLEYLMEAEGIRLILNNNGQRTGRGRYVQSNRRRS